MKIIDKQTGKIIYMLDEDGNLVILDNVKKEKDEEESEETDDTEKD